MKGKIGIILGVLLVLLALLLPYLRENVFFEDVFGIVSEQDARVIAEEKVHEIYRNRDEIGPYTLEVGKPKWETGMWVVEVKIHAEKLGEGDYYLAWVKIRANEVIVETCA